MGADFESYIPGKWSSHPTALSRQRVWLFLAGLAPLIVLGVLAVVAFTELDTWKLLVQHPLLWIKVFATVFCFSMGATLTLVMLNMVSRTVAQKGGPGERDELPFPWWVVAAGAFFWVIPAGLSFFREYFWDGPYFGIIQFLLNILCFAPFIMILLWVLLARNEDELKDKTQRSKLLGLLWTVFLGLAIFSLFGDVHAALSHWSVTAGWVSGIHSTVLRLVLFATLFPLASVCFAVWRLLRFKSGKNNKKEQTGANIDEQKPEKENDKNPPAWAVELCNKPPEGVAVDGGVPKKESLTEVSPLMENAPVEDMVLLGGKKPTRTQYEFLSRFKNAYGAAIHKAINSGGVEPVPARADILLTGHSGSGRTEVLCAAALYAALVRGQHVLYITRDDEQAKAISQRLNSRLNEMFLGHYVWSDVLTKPMADGWLSEKSETVSPLLVGTPEVVEAAFFSNATTIDGNKLKRMRGIILGFEIVLVDDFMEMPVAVRSHMAFILDKLRLLLASEYIIPQFVVVTPPLQAPEGVEKLGMRLFGSQNFDRNNNVITLKPRPCNPFWELTLRVSEAGRLDKVCEELVRNCLHEHLNVLLYRKGIGGQVRQNLEKSLLEGQDGGKLRVVSHLDSAAGDGVAPDAVFYLSVICGNATVALRLNLGDGEETEQSVFIRIAMVNEKEETDGPLSPLIPDESAMPLRVAHLRSVLQFIEPCTPIEASVWSHFGISLSHEWLPEGVPSDDVPQLLSWSHDEHKEEDRYPTGTIWPYLVLDRVASVNTRGQKIDLNVLPTSREMICRLPDEKRLLLVKGREYLIDGQRPVSQLALWKDERGNNIRESDLAHLDSLKIETSDDVYIAESWKSPTREEAERFALSFKPLYWHGNTNEHEIPLRSFNWRFPGAFQSADGSIWTTGALAGFEMKHPGGAFCRIEAELSGAVSLSGNEIRRSPQTFAYQAHASALVLGQTLPGGNKDAADIRRCLNGKWETRQDGGFSPVLTHAVTAVLRRKLNGFPFFAFAPVFYTAGREASVGAAVLWLLEPVNSGRTVFPVLKQLLLRDAFKRNFLKELKAEVERFGSLEQMRVASRLAFGGETHDAGDVAVALNLIELLIAETPFLRPEWTGEDDTAAGDDDGGEDVSRKYRESYTKEEQEFDTTVVTGLLKFQDSIDVTKFAVEYKWGEKRINNTLNDVLWNNPQLFYVSKSHRYQWWHDCSGNITRFLLLDFQYDDAVLNEFSRCKGDFDHAVSQALAKLKAITDPVKKALVLHDYIVEICEYDKEAADTKDISPKARTAYSVLVRHQAVCEGYAMAYRYLLNLVGIQSEEILTDTHCWNYVKISDHWYHVDVTHDDPIYIGGKPEHEKISHEFFMLSDDAIHRKGHLGWNTRGLPPANNTRFDNHNWDEIS